LKDVDTSKVHEELRRIESEVIPKLRALPQISDHDLNDAKKALSEFKAVIVEACQHLRYKATTVDDAKQKLEAASALVSTITGKLGNEDAYLKELSDLADEVSSDDACKCPKCKQLVDTSRLSKMIAHQQNIVNKIDSELTAAEDRESWFESLVKNLEDYDSLKEYVRQGESNVGVADKLNAAVKRRDELSSMSKKISDNMSIAAEIQMLMSKHSASIKSPTLDKDIEDLEATVEENKQRRQSYSDAHFAKMAVNETLQALGISDDEAEDVIVSVKDLSATAKSAQAELDKLNSQVTKAYVTLHSYKSTISSENTKQKRLAELQSKMDALKKLKEQEYVITQTLPAYSNSGLKMEKLQLLLKSLAKRLPYWTKLLFTEKDFSIEVKGDSKKLSLIAPKTFKFGKVEKTIKVDVAALSGGEQSRVAICLMLAMADIVATSKKANMLVFDEVDRHMDTLGQRLTASFLVPNLRRKKSALYLISHSQMIDPASFDRKLVITKHPTGETDIKYSSVQKRM
jgi:DNA repair exonuclease SbcCD ATPase subunit